MPLTTANIKLMIADYCTDETQMKSLIDLCVKKATDLMKADLSSLHDNIISKIDVNLTNTLAQRVEELERRMTLNNIHMDLLRRRLDDTEQYTRRPNLIIDGIPVTPGESPTTLRKKMLAEIDHMGIDIDDVDIDRVHRHEDPYFDAHGRKIQPVIIRFVSWYARNELYAKRFESRYRYRADLTCRRQQILNYARDKVEHDHLSNIVDFVAADRNCRLIMRSITGKMLSFSSEVEFDNLVQSLIDPGCSLVYADKYSYLYDNPVEPTSLTKPVASFAAVVSNPPPTPPPMTSWQQKSLYQRSEHSAVVNHSW